MMMKKLIVLFLVLFAVSCNNKLQEDGKKYKEELCKFSFDNRSGVQVAVVIDFDYQPNTAELNIPDSLILQPDQKYSWDLYVLEFYTKMSPIFNPHPPLGPVWNIKVYFDKTVLVEYPTKKDRNPAVLSNYERSSSDDEKYKKQWTYTFTEEDYRQALEQNKQ